MILHFPVQFLLPYQYFTPSEAFILKLEDTINKRDIIVSMPQIIP